VDCYRTIIAFAQYVQEATIDEMEMLVKDMKAYKDRCLANQTLPECSEIAVSKLLSNVIQ
jgi:hypothetical protein